MKMKNGVARKSRKRIVIRLALVLVFISVISCSYAFANSYKTKGAIWTHTRDQTSVGPRYSDSLYWSNYNHVTGTYWAEAEAPYGNHYGQCEVWEE